MIQMSMDPFTGPILFSLQCTHALYVFVQEYQGSSRSILDFKELMKNLETSLSRLRKQRIEIRREGPEMHYWLKLVLEAEQKAWKMLSGIEETFLGTYLRHLLAPENATKSEVMWSLTFKSFWTIHGSKLAKEIIPTLENCISSANQMVMACESHKKDHRFRQTCGLGSSSAANNPQVTHELSG